MRLVPRQAVPASTLAPLHTHKGQRRALYHFAQHACGHCSQCIETRKLTQALARTGTRYFSLRFRLHLAIYIYIDKPG